MPSISIRDNQKTSEKVRSYTSPQSVSGPRSRLVDDSRIHEACGSWLFLGSLEARSEAYAPDTDTLKHPSCQTFSSPKPLPGVRFPEHPLYVDSAASLSPLTHSRKSHFRALPSLPSNALSPSLQGMLPQIRREIPSVDSQTCQSLPTPQYPIQYLPHSCPSICTLLHFRQISKVGWMQDTIWHAFCCPLVPTHHFTAPLTPTGHPAEICGRLV